MSTTDVRHTLRTMAENLAKYAEHNGGIHDEDCPGDDTCSCSGKPLNDAANGACRLLAQLAPLVDEIPRRVSLHLTCLPANLKEITRGLENGFFGPPVPLGHRGPETQPWANACMAMVTANNAIDAVQHLQMIVFVLSDGAVDPR
jgi:hypothetical protein